MRLVPHAILLLLLTAPLRAHEGHDEISILTGTVRNVEKDRLEIETNDRTTFQRKNVWILLDDKTKFLLGKKKVDGLDLAFGRRVETVIRSEHGLDDSVQFRAVQIRVSEPKRPASSNR